MRLHPELELVGATDRVPERAERFTSRRGIRAYKSTDELLGDGRVEMVLNLTNPRVHHEISTAALEAGKHVWSEKPLAVELEPARELVALAERKGLGLSSAPSSFLSETAQTMWKAVRNRVVGPVRLVYAEMDDGLVHRMPYRIWASASGAPWPYRDEFETGCTLEHAGYSLTWLCGMFGRAESVTAFSSVQVVDKAPDVPAEAVAPDFSVAAIAFKSGVVARLTCSILAPHDRHLRIFGDDGVLYTKDVWPYRMPVYVRKYMTIRRKMILSPLRRRVPLLGKSNELSGNTDFARGPAELAAAVREKRPSRLSAAFSLHVNELTLAIQNAGADGGAYRMTTSFDPPEPMPWAR
jgi:predicted dehydrogenase